MLSSHSSSSQVGGEAGGQAGPPGLDPVEEEGLKNLKGMFYYEESIYQMLVDSFQAP